MTLFIRAERLLDERCFVERDDVFEKWSRYYFRADSNILLFIIGDLRQARICGFP